MDNNEEEDAVEGQVDSVNREYVLVALNENMKSLWTLRSITRV